MLDQNISVPGTPIGFTVKQQTPDNPTKGVPETQPGFDVGKFSTNVKNLYREYLGRDPSQEELSSHINYAATRSYYEPVERSYEGLKQQLSGSQEHKNYLTSKQREQQQEESKLAYQAYQPFATQQYNQLYDFLTSQRGDFSKSLQYGLGARGLSDSGSLAQGLTDIGKYQLGEASKIGGGIEEGRLRYALGEGDKEREFARQQQLLANRQDFEQQIKNQEIAAQMAEANLKYGTKQPGFWDYLASAGGQAAGTYGTEALLALLAL